MSFLFAMVVFAFAVFVLISITIAAYLSFDGYTGLSKDIGKAFFKSLLTW